jgi:hypothetical protein
MAGRTSTGSEAQKELSLAVSARKRNRRVYVETDEKLSGR